MFGNGISFSGLASGIDTQSIINQLVALERLPIQQIEAKKNREQQKLDLFGTFKRLIETLQEKAKALSTTAEFFSYTVGGGFEGVADIAATGGAAAGSHSLEVIQTAGIDRWAFDGVADPSVDLGTASGQSIDFDVNGTSYSVAVNVDESSLQEIAEAINSAAGDDVTASIVNAGTTANPSYQLVLAARESGADAVITNIASSLPGLAIDSDPGNTAYHITTGQNAQARIDGLLVQRADNDFSDVLDGISIDLLSVGEGEVTFTVDADREAIRGRVEELIDAYNEVIAFVNKQNTFSEDEDAIAALFGDSTLGATVRSIRSALFGVDLSTVQNDTEGYSTLGLIGIDQASDGTLSIVDSKFDAKLTENLELFADLFVDSDGFDNGGAEPNTPGFFQDTTADSGLAATLSRAIDQLIGTQDGPIIDVDTGERLVIEGLLRAKEATFGANIKRFTDQIESKERRLDLFEQNLIQRFAALEELMGGLNAQGSALVSALQALPNLAHN